MQRNKEVVASLWLDSNKLCFVRRNLRIEVRYGFGMQYLLELIRRPWNSISAVDLYYLEELGDSFGEQKHQAQSNQAGRISPGIFSAIPMCDQQTLEEVKKRLEAVLIALTEANDNNDLSRCEELSNEKEALLIYLQEVLNHRQRIRNFADNQSHIVDSVRKALLRCINQISSSDPELAEALRGSIRMGKELSYQPDGLRITLRSKE